MRLLSLYRAYAPVRFPVPGPVMTILHSSAPSSGRNWSPICALLSRIYFDWPTFLADLHHVSTGLCLDFLIGVLSSRVGEIFSFFTAHYGLRFLFVLSFSSLFFLLWPMALQSKFLNLINSALRSSGAIPFFCRSHSFCWNFSPFFVILSRFSYSFSPTCYSSCRLSLSLGSFLYGPFGLFLIWLMTELFNHRTYFTFSKDSPVVAISVSTVEAL